MNLIQEYIFPEENKNDTKYLKIKIVFSNINNIDKMLAELVLNG